MHIEEEITSASLLKYETLKKMTRDELSTAFEETYGWPAHPRIAKDFLVKAIARKFQDDLWIKQSGSIPEHVRRASIEFWNNNEVPFVAKEAIRDEKAQEMKRGRIETRKTIQKVESNSLGVQASTIVLLNPNMPMSSNYARVIDILTEHLGQMTFIDLEKKCGKIMSKEFNLSAALVILNGRKAIEIKVASTVVDQVEIIVAEEKLPEVSVVMKSMIKKDKKKKTAVMGEHNFQTALKTTHQVAMVGSH